MQGGLLFNGPQHSPWLWTPDPLHHVVQHGKPHARPLTKVLNTHIRGYCNRLLLVRLDVSDKLTTGGVPKAKQDYHK